MQGAGCEMPPRGGSLVLRRTFQGRHRGQLFPALSYRPEQYLRRICPRRGGQHDIQAATRKTAQNTVEGRKARFDCLTLSLVYLCPEAQEIP